IYIDVEVDEFHVLQFHRFRAVLEAAMPAKAKLRRQLLRVLASQTAETLPPAPLPPTPAPGKKRLGRLKGLAPGRRGGGRATGAGRSPDKPQRKSAFSEWYRPELPRQLHNCHSLTAFCPGSVDLPVFHGSAALASSPRALPRG